MNNKKRTVIISSLIMALALVVTVVGVSAAWFSDITRVSNTITISSERPKGFASIDVDSASSSFSGEEGTIAPAVIKKGWMLGDYAGAGGYDKLKVTDEALADAAQTDDTKPLISTATTVTVYFPFMYQGASDIAVGDGKKSVAITLTSTTLTNPRKETENGGTEVDKSLANYLSEFKSEMSIVTATETTDGEGHIVYEYGDEVSQDVVKWSTKIENELYIVSIPGVKYFFKVTLYFAKVDEECSPALLNTKVFFNFEIASADRRSS